MVAALITGGGRGVGRGVVESLAEVGASVWFTARDQDQLDETVAAIETLGGRAHPILFDHARTEGLDDIFSHIAQSEGGLDLLVNNVWGGYERMIEDGRFTWADCFWDQPDWRWDAMMTVGVKTAFIAGGYAAKQMRLRKSGLIVNISFWSAQKYIGNTIYGVAKAATDKMTADMAHELKGSGVSVISFYPGLVRTEKVMENADFLDLTNSESPRYIGRVIAALLASNDVAALSGQVCVAAEIGQRLGIVDIDGKIPEPLNIESA